METITEQGTPICLDFETSHMFTCVVVIWSIIHVGVIVVLSALLVLFFTCRGFECLSLHQHLDTLRCKASCQQDASPSMV
jgi:hypothetical protein